MRGLSKFFGKVEKKVGSKVATSAEKNAALQAEKEAAERAAKKAEEEAAERAAKKVEKESVDKVAKKGIGKGKIALGTGSAFGLYEMITHTGDDECPLDSNYPSCIVKMAKNDIKGFIFYILKKLAEVLLLGIIIYIVITTVISLVGGVVMGGKSAYNYGKKRLSEFRSPPQSAKVALPSSNFEGEGEGKLVTMAGGGKNNLDKYMYCLILLLGIGIHHLYENYKNKINQYSGLIDKEKEKR